MQQETTGRDTSTHREPEEETAEREAREREAREEVREREAREREAREREAHEREKHEREKHERETFGAGPEEPERLHPDRSSEGSVRVLLKQLVNDVTLLVSKEVAVARSEFSHAVSDVKKGATSLVSGGAILYAGFLFLLAAATIALANVVDPWLAALIVGGITAVIGMIMVSSGKKKMQPSAGKMSHTTDSLNRDRQMLRGLSNEQR